MSDEEMAGGREGGWDGNKASAHQGSFGHTDKVGPLWDQNEAQRKRAYRKNL